MMPTGTDERSVLIDRLADVVHRSYCAGTRCHAESADLNTAEAIVAADDIGVFDPETHVAVERWCVCGEPGTENVHHRRYGPCYMLDGMVVVPADELQEMVDLIRDAVAQACDNSGVLDSMAISTWADAMRLLARHGRLVIDDDKGRRVIGRWV